MAGKLIGVGVSGGGSSGYKFIQYNAANQVWNGAAFESWLDAHYSTYLTTATEQGTSGVYFGDEVANAIRYVMRKVGGSTPSTDPVAWEDVISADLIGPNTVTIHFKDDLNNPVPNVFFSIPGIGAGKADGSGDAVFGMTSGTYTVISAPTNGVVFPNATLVVPGGSPLTIIGTGAHITPAPPGQTTAYLYTRDGHGVIIPNTTLAFTILEPNTGVDAWNTTNFTATSDTNGLLQTTLVQGAKYRVQWPNGQDTEFTTGVDATYPIPEVLGN